MCNASQIRKLRIIAYVVILALGIAQAWATRHIIFSDGISYLEIASAYLRGDWANAINSYWSPFYSWLIAATLWLLRPGPYWQASVLHIVNFIAYAAALVALDLLIGEILRAMQVDVSGPNKPLSPCTIYVAAYTAFPVAALGIIGYNSPDTISVALMLLLSALILKVRHIAGFPMMFVLIGVTCGVYYLARTGFAPLVPLCILAVLIPLRHSNRSLLKPAAVMTLAVLATCAPFVLAISHKQHHFTIGEAGKLTYGWEASGAIRFTHWQGEPHDIGVPTHPTKKISTHPDAYVFDGPVGGTYPPWFDPTYWYDGIKPKLKPALQLRVFSIGALLVIRLLLASPITIPCIILIAHMGLLIWLRKLWSFWPMLLPTIAGLLLYCLVYVEKRYIASNLIVIWLAVLASIRIRGENWQNWANRLTQTLCLVFFAYFLYSRAYPPVAGSLWDLTHLREHDKNLNYMFAERLKNLGLQAGDKVAFIGIGTNADWARLDDVRIVGEIPIVWQRPQKLLDNYLIENSEQVRAFWKADATVRKHILEEFRGAGAVMVVTDGLYNKNFPPEWKPVLTPIEIGKPRFKDDIDYERRQNCRYVWLVSPHTQPSTSAGANRRSDGKRS
ncbi:MAG: hypothetical protein JO108_34610 [Acidobacteriaceae bacterium]|nr:hypothetical protein [Acidobacteriaceae bacterium]